MILPRTFIGKMIPFHFLIVSIYADPPDDRTGYLTSDQLEYLSARLYPAECTYLTNSLSEILRTNSSKSLKNLTEDIAVERPETHCLIKLEEWNEMGLKDERAHSHVEQILREMGRYDLAAYLSKTNTRITSPPPSSKCRNKFQG